jgi:DNA (cytosine-5)-methyltransferase 1
VTTGYKAAGLQVVGAVDIDADAVATFAANHPDVCLTRHDLLTLDAKKFRRSLKLGRRRLDILTICAPCQSFSSLSAKHRRRNDPRNGIVSALTTFVEVFKPRCVVMENVPLLATKRRFKDLVRGLRRAGYGVRFDVINAADFGVPQTRRRLVLLAMHGVRESEVPKLTPQHPAIRRRVARRTVRDTLSRVRPRAGDVLSRTRKYPQLVARRIAAIPKDGGSRASLPEDLRLDCHTKSSDKTACGNVYGRMRWDDVAPTLTTRCTTPACGRFLHPTKNRAITLREAAVLQTFPADYAFTGGHMSISAQIGNAVPPKLATLIGLVVSAALAKGKAVGRSAA